MSDRKGYGTQGPQGPQGTSSPQGPQGEPGMKMATHVSFWNSNSFWYYTRPEQARFIHSPVLFEANRIKNFYPTNWHREHQIVYVKADLQRT